MASARRTKTAEEIICLDVASAIAEAALTAMDEAYHKHHLWAFPKLKRLPSEYFRSNGAASER